MKKKLTILAVLKQDKPTMILNEPFNGIDLETSRIDVTCLTFQVVPHMKGRNDQMNIHVKSAPPSGLIRTER